MKTVLLVLDMQEFVLGLIPGADTVIANAAKAIAAARNAGIQVIYCTISFRAGYPELRGDNKFFSNLKPRLEAAKDKLNIHPYVAPEPGDIVVVKKRISAFSGNDLEIILRSLKTEHIVMCGTASGRVLLTILLAANDKDFKISVLSDCSADFDHEVHNMLITKLFVPYADVVSADEWISGLLTA
ncbi:MAG: cysteine hydrolase [Bacteroidota bacterium]